MDEKFTVMQYTAARCMQFDNITVGIALYILTSGRPCDGCPKYQCCEALDLLRKTYSEPQAPQKNAPVEPTETVRDEARRLGIGIKEVRRRRRRAAQ